MRVWWKDRRLGDYEHEKSLTFDEMHQVKKQLGKQYQHPTLFIAAALTLVDRLDVKRDAAGEPVLDGSGAPQLEIVPNENWDPDAMRMFVVLMGRRVGEDWYFEDLGDGRLSDLKLLADPGEEESAEEGPGKDARETTLESSLSLEKTSTTSSTDASPVSGSTSA